MFGWLIVYSKQLSFIYLQENPNRKKLYGAILTLLAFFAIYTPLVGCKESLNHVGTDVNMCNIAIKPMGAVSNVYFWLFIFWDFRNEEGK